MSGLFGKMKIMICTAKSGDFIMDVLASFWWLGGPVESNTAFKTNRCARRGCAFLCISGLVRVLDFQFRQVKQKYNPMYKLLPISLPPEKFPFNLLFCFPSQSHFKNPFYQSESIISLLIVPLLFLSCSLVDHSSIFRR